MNRKLSLIAMLLIVSLTLPLIATPIAHAVPTDLNTLIVDTIGEPMDLDPAWSYDTSSAELLMNVYEPLLWFNRTEMATYIPMLATEWVGQVIDETSPEGIVWKNRWTFKIRENVHFQTDGVPPVIPGEGALLTPQDVEYTFERFFVTDAATGPAWMVWDPMFAASWAGDLNATLTGLGWPVNATTHWNTKMDEAIDHAVESNATHVWFNLVMPYEPFLQIVAQQWGSIMNKDWCVWHTNDFPGFDALADGDYWYLYHDPATSPLYAYDPSAPGPNLDAALGTGPYMLDYWNKGVGNAWSVVKNNNYWRGWDYPFVPEGWAGHEIDGHVTRYTSNYIPEWATRRLRFLGGVSDFCAVPRQYMIQVLDQPGIECIYPLPTLQADGAFFTFNVSATSTRMGEIQNPGVFKEAGAPMDFFNELNVRLGFAHLFDYTSFLYAAFLNEAIAPVTPIVPGLSYYDPAIGKAEEPTLLKLKEYGISTEASGQKAYDLELAKTYLRAAWGGALWSTGFTMDIVYNEGNLERQIAAQLIKDAFDTINAEEGTKFHITISSIAWSIYKLEWKARNLPIFIVGWLADYPDAHNFAHPFMNSAGAFSKWQGTLGETQFPNAYVDDLIAKGIGTIIPAERQGNYTLLQQYYVDNAPSLTLIQPTGRHFQRDWVEGWYYNPIYPGAYAYDLWKNVAVTVYDVDVGITAMSDVVAFEVGQPVPDNTMTIFATSPVDVTVSRLDANSAVPLVLVIVGIGLRNETDGREIILGTETFTVGIGGVEIVSFESFDQDLAQVINVNETYKVFGIVLVMSGFAQDTNSANNIYNAQIVTTCSLTGDINVDGFVELGDFFLESQAFGSYPGHPRWDIRCDLQPDDFIELGDFFILSQHFGQSISGISG